MAKFPLIGLEVLVTNSKNPSVLGVRGTIINETKNTLVIETTEGKKTFIKNQVTLKVMKSGEIIKGTKIVGRPEERIKSKVKN